ncbi:hypothetical protein [Pseudarthrobacter sp. BIM B-2242]|uniref:hypothetical protein n=1 Tax=Pseudarthrobacter sp. BIM B-2242 TaxID=2772401 RepID=UPI00168B7CA2|nr:hypothetical protein [Pseudarthrobacter sp. BIM B-2242]QOD03205.1 hypothetical protein IDT60_18175 [Pseudarthrobacter sp. BIM B-2242]
MTSQTNSARRSPVVAACVVFLGLLVLWIAQPALPSWGCATSPAMCPPHLLPVRASLISAGILSALLATVIVGLLLWPRANIGLGRMSRSVVFAVPVILVLTVVAHFLIPQP